VVLKRFGYMAAYHPTNMRSTGTTVTVTRKTKKYEITYIQSTTPGNQGVALKELTEQIEKDLLEAGLE